MKIKQIAFLLLLIFAFSNCENESEPVDKSKFGYEYFPVVTSKYIDYKYDSLIIDDEGLKQIMSSGFLRHEIGEEFVNGEGKKSNKYYKYWKKNMSDAWKLTDVESVTKSDTKVIMTEENLPFVKLVFPNAVGTKWDATGLFDEDLEVTIAGEPIKMYQGWSPRILDKGSNLDLYKSFPNTLTAKLVDETGLLAKRFISEVYAFDLGLIKKEMIIYDTQKTQSPDPWDKKAEKGFKLTMEIINHN